MRVHDAQTRFLGWPITRLGRISLRLPGGFVVFLGLMQILVTTGQEGGDTFFDNLWLSIPALIAMISGVAALGVLLAIFLIGELSL